MFLGINILFPALFLTFNPAHHPLLLFFFCLSKLSLHTNAVWLLVRSQANGAYFTADCMLVFFTIFFIISQCVPTEKNSGHLIFCLCSSVLIQQVKATRSAFYFSASEIGEKPICVYKKQSIWLHTEGLSRASFQVPLVWFDLKSVYLLKLFIS